MQHSTVTRLCTGYLRTALLSLEDEVVVLGDAEEDVVCTAVVVGIAVGDINAVVAS